VATALLLQFFNELPERSNGEPAATWHQRYQAALEAFGQRVFDRYTEGTLMRLLDTTHAVTRQSACLALGLRGGMGANRRLATMLHDEDLGVRQTATEALWSIWFRAGTAEQNSRLRQLMQAAANSDGHLEKVLAGFDDLIAEAPDFAEAYNQRAVVHFRRGEFDLAAKDCERVLKLNPVHFGAVSGLAKSYMKQRKLRAALRAYRRSLRINPNLEEVRQAIRSLEKTLGE
jgi:tetratricopeptide (TPR) repeat protein